MSIASKLSSNRFVNFIGILFLMFTGWIMGMAYSNSNKAEAAPTISNKGCVGAVYVPILSSGCTTKGSAVYTVWSDGTLKKVMDVKRP